MSISRVSLVSRIEHAHSNFDYKTALFLSELLHTLDSCEANKHCLAVAMMKNNSPLRLIVTLLSQCNGDDCRYLLAMCYFQMEKYVDAETALLYQPGKEEPRSIKNVPNGADGLFLLGKVYTRTSRAMEAQVHFKQCLMLDPLHWAAFDALASLGLSIEEPLSFLVPLEESEMMLSSETPLKTDYHIQAPKATKDESFLKEKKFQPATTHVKPRSKLFVSPSETPMNTKPILAFASIGGKVNNIQIENKKSDSSESEALKIFVHAYRLKCSFHCLEAKDLFLSLPTKFLSSGLVQIQIANCYFEMSNYAKAIEHFRYARLYSPYRIEGMDLFSSALWQLRRHDELSALAHQLHAIAPYSVQSQIASGNIFSLEKDHDTALKFFQKAIDIDPFNVYAHSLTGHELVSTENVEKALTCYRHALRLNEKFYNAWYGIGNIYLRQEKFKMAVYHFQKAIEIHPYNSVLYCNLGMALHSNKESVEAVNALTKASELEQVPSHARFQLANVLLSLNLYQDAIDQLSKVVTYAPKEAAVHFLLGKIYSHLGFPVKAMSYFNTALDLDPKDSNQVKSLIEKMPKTDHNDLNFESIDEDDGILHDSDCDDDSVIQLSDIEEFDEMPDDS